MPYPTPTPYQNNPLTFKQRHRFTIEIELDLVHLAEDQAQNSGMTLQAWVQAYANEGLKLILQG